VDVVHRAPQPEREASVCMTVTLDGFHAGFSLNKRRFSTNQVASSFTCPDT